MLESEIQKADIAVEMPSLEERSAVSAQKVVKYIREDIVQEKYKPSERLIESKISEEQGTTRPVVHEALKQLEVEGLVQFIPRKGFIVSTLTLAQAEDIYQAREVLEGLASRLFTMRATRDQINKLESAIDDLEVAAQYPEEKALLVSAKNHVYDVLCEGCGNGVIILLLRSLRDRISWLRTRTLSYSGRPSYTVKELRDILEAIKRENPEEAERASIRHVREAAKVAYTLLRRRDMFPE